VHIYYIIFIDHDIYDSIHFLYNNMFISAVLLTVTRVWHTRVSIM